MQNSRLNQRFAWLDLMMAETSEQRKDSLASKLVDPWEKQSAMRSADRWVQMKAAK